MPYRVLPGGASSSRVYLVDAGGNGDHQTIQAALNAAHAQAPTAEARWLVLVGPGIYAESLNLYDHVDVAGLAPGPAAIVQAPSGYPAVAVPASCWLSNLRLGGESDPILQVNLAGIELTLDNLVIRQAAVSVGGVKLTAAATLCLRQCDIQSGGHALRVGAGTVTAVNSRFAHQHSQAGAPTEAAVLMDGGSLTLDKCVIENLSPAGAGVSFSANPSLARLVHCTVRKASGSYSVDAVVSCANASVLACALNAAVSTNLGVSAGNTINSAV